MTIIRSEIPEKMITIDDGEVDRFLQNLHEMDRDVTAYLKDPDNNPAPDYQRLVVTIRGIPERGDQSHVLSAKISALKYKAYYFERSWRQIRANVAYAADRKRQGHDGPRERRKESYFCAPTITKKAEMENRGQKVAPMLYDMQKVKWKEHGVSTGEGSPESQNRFNDRIRNTYQKLKDQGDENSKLVLVWNNETKKCDLIVDKRTHEHGTEPVTPPPKPPSAKDD